LLSGCTHRRYDHNEPVPAVNPRMICLAWCSFPFQDTTPAFAVKPCSDTVCPRAAVARGVVGRTRPEFQETFARKRASDPGIITVLGRSDRLREPLSAPSGYEPCPGKGPLLPMVLTAGAGWLGPSLPLQPPASHPARFFFGDASCRMLEREQNDYHDLAKRYLRLAARPNIQISTISTIAGSTTRWLRPKKRAEGSSARDYDWHFDRFGLMDGVVCPISVRRAEASSPSPRLGP